MSMLRTYNNMLLAAGSYKKEMQRALLWSGLSSIVQGITFSLLYPLFARLYYYYYDISTANSGIEDDNDENRKMILNECVQLGIIMLVLIVLEAIIRLQQLETEYTTQMDIGEETRIKLGETLRRMPLEVLHKRQAGDLNVVLSGDVNDVVMIMGSLYAVVIQTIVTPLTTIVITFVWIDKRLALAQCCFFPVAIPLYQLIRKAASKENRISKQAHANVANHLIEYTQGLEVLRATRQVGAQSIRLQDALRSLRQKQTIANNWGVVPNILMSTIVQVGILVVTILAIYYCCWNQTLEVHVLFALLAITVRFAEPLSIFAALATMFDFMEAGLERIRALLQVQPLPIIVPSTSQPTPLGSERAATTLDITFDNVNFAYAPEETDSNNNSNNNNNNNNNSTSDDSKGGEQVLRNITFHVPAQSLTALVGESGGGKTTIAKLLCRYADPQIGSIRIGGVDIRSLEQSELMKQMSVVFQDVYLFDDSIGDNIRMAKPHATNTQVEAAAMAANCHEFITRLPEGYNTKVGEIGGSLSGGERQRISIARAILKDAPIVVLDEPTSALDTESEVAVQRAIDGLVENKTVLVIAHRLSTVVAADQILVLQGGRIVERGTHDVLVELKQSSGGGKYAAMWAAQQESKRWKI